MKVAAILPHLGPFGGVRRFLEIGNEFIKRQISYTVFSGRQSICPWFDFHGEIKSWSDIKADYILIGDPPSFRILPKVKGKVFIYVIAGGHFLKMYKGAYGKYPFIVNNRVFLKYFPKARLIEGGVNTHHFKPSRPVTVSDRVKVLYYLSPRVFKGSNYIKTQLTGIKGVELIGFRGLNNTELVRRYQDGDFFVAWESREGWPNTAAEALASGLTVVTNGVNCEPFMSKVIRTKELRHFFSSPKHRKIRKRCSMAEFSWEVVVNKLLEAFNQYT